MKISTRSRYALRVLIRLAGAKEPVPLAQLAEAEGVSKKYMEHIATALRRAGIIKSARGPLGGYVLAKDPMEISLLDISRALEKGVAPVRCAEDPDWCPKAPTCKARRVWVGLWEAMKGYMESVKLGEIANGAPEP